MATTDPIRDQEQLRDLADYFLERNELRNYTLIVLATCTALRIGDLLNLKWSSVYDKEHARFRKHLKLTEEKTGKTKTIALNEQAIDALRLYYPHSRSNFIFVNNRLNDPQPISRIQAWRIIKGAAEKLGLDDNIACHSLRKTWGYQAWINGISPVLITEVYNHSSYEVTKRYLGVQQDELDQAYLEMKLF